MATVVDICNLALARLGDRANVASIDPPEGSVQADHCARFYPIARDAALEAHDWSFASVRVHMAQVAFDHIAWEYAFALPNNALALRAVGYSEEQLFAFDPRGPYFERASMPSGYQVILTNEPTPYARITQRMVDPTRFPPLFTQALVTLLAAYLAGPVVKGRSGAQMSQALMQDFLGQISQAAVTDANQSNVKQRFKPSNMARRGVTLGVNPHDTLQGGVPYWAI